MKTRRRTQHRSCASLCLAWTNTVLSRLLDNTNSRAGHEAAPSESVALFPCLAAASGGNTSVFWHDVDYNMRSSRILRQAAFRGCLPPVYLEILSYRVRQTGAYRLRQRGAPGFTPGHAQQSPPCFAPSSAPGVGPHCRLQGGVSFHGCFVTSVVPWGPPAASASESAGEVRVE